MGFTGGFRSIFTPTYDAGLASKWWLAGGVADADCVAAYQAKGAASYAASKVNLANPGTYDAADGTAYPTWAAATGWTFDGSSRYLRSGLAPLPAGSVIIRIASVSNAGYQIGAVFSSAARYAIGAMRGAGPSVRWVNGALVEVAPGVSSGVLAIAGTVAYRNGSQDSTGVGTSTAIALEMLIGCLNNEGTPGLFSDGAIISVAIYSSTLTATQVAAITAAMQAL
jgi:hypothetical protein